MLKHLHKSIAALPIQVHWKWIRGHQDRHKQTFTIWELDNIKVDTLAQECRRNLPLSYIPSNCILSGEGPRVFLDDEKCSKMELKAVQSSYIRSRQTQYWCTKFGLTTKQITTIDWKSQAQAFRPLPLARRQRTIKLSTGQCGISFMMKRWKFEEHNECPFCARSETKEHLFQCQDERVRARWDQHVIRLDDWMATQSTSPTICDAITTSLLTWGEDIVPWSDKPSVQTLMSTQLSIGWYPFVFGFVHKAWHRQQAAYLQVLSSNKNPERWTCMLIQKLFAIAWDMWDHRNYAKHNSLTADKLCQDDQVNQEVRAQFDIGTEGLLPCDRHLLEDFPMVIFQPLTKKKYWLQVVTQARRRYERRQLE